MCIMNFFCHMLQRTEGAVKRYEQLVLRQVRTEEHPAAGTVLGGCAAAHLCAATLAAQQSVSSPERRASTRTSD